jgi:hypothetical protein
LTLIVRDAKKERKGELWSLGGYQRLSVDIFTDILPFMASAFIPVDALQMLAWAVIVAKRYYVTAVCKDGLRKFNPRRVAMPLLSSA